MSSSLKETLRYFATFYYDGPICEPGSWMFNPNGTVAYSGEDMARLLPLNVSVFNAVSCSSMHSYQVERSNQSLLVLFGRAHATMYTFEKPYFVYAAELFAHLDALICLVEFLQFLCAFMFGPIVLIPTYIVQILAFVLFNLIFAQP